MNDWWLGAGVGAVDGAGLGSEVLANTAGGMVGSPVGVGVVGAKLGVGA